MVPYQVGEKDRHRYISLSGLGTVWMHRPERTSQPSLPGRSIGTDLEDKEMILPCTSEEGTGQLPGLPWPSAQE